MAETKQTIADLIKVASGKETIKVNVDDETLKQVKQSTYVLAGALAFLAVSILSRRK